jgi:protein TonB
MMKFLATNIKYPKEAKKAGITGTVLAQFIINKDGRVTDINILRGIGAGCDVETKRVISEMPLWNPAQMKGKPVNFQLVLPVKFSL